MEQKFKLLENFDNYQSEYISKLSGKIPHYEVVGPIISLFLNRIIRNGAFYMNVHFEDLAAILSDGELKSNMITGNSATVGGEKSRIESTCAMYNVREEDLKPEDYPKFGYLSCADTRINFFTNLDYVYQYGDVVFRFKKENLLHRTMLVIGDSMNFGHFYALVPTRVSYPLASCIYGLSNGHSVSLSAGFERNPGSLWYYFVEKILAKEITTDNFYRMQDIIGSENPYFDFFELQYIGPLMLKNDVECIDIFRKNFEGREDLLKTTEEYCKSTGIQLNLHEL
ncbi:MAG: hypothetical protein J6M93_00515 [Succinivibrio sp.]|nr:hypothetical protein [Succinivibrio sp.]